MIEPGSNGRRPEERAGQPSEADEAAPEGRAVAAALRAGLGAERAHHRFTDAVMWRIAGARERGQPPPPVTGVADRAGRVPRRTWRERARAAAFAAAAAWTIAFALGIAHETMQPRGGATLAAVVRKTGGAEPRAGWVKLDMLAELGRAGLIDRALASGQKQGYRFEAYWDGEDPFRWWILASPAVPGKSGDRYFLIDETGVIRFEDGAVPTRDSPRIGG